MDNNYLGHTINHLRKEKGWTQDQLAEKLGISFQAVSKWENATSFPDITMLPQLADIFGITIDEFFREPSKEIEDKLQEEAAQEMIEPPVETLHVYEVGYDSDGKSSTEFESVDDSDQGYRDVEEKNDDGLDRGQSLPWENDGKLRAVLYQGHKLVKNTKPHELKLVVEVEGDVHDLISDFSVNCNDVYGNATAGDSMNCNDVYKDANAGDHLNCNDVHGNVSAGDSIHCNDIGGDATAGDNIECQDIGGRAVAGGSIRH